ncbi:hypothetical protein PO78_4449 [Thauera sp. SWB20]|nr:hypothetical protein PO78_4449 [Thauera sp. SWB20]
MLGQTEQVAAFVFRHQKRLYRQPLHELTGICAGKAGECLHVGQVDLTLAGKVGENVGFLCRKVRAQAGLGQNLCFGDELFLA